MKVKKNIKLSKRLLFTSLAAVALLGATQPVSAEMYTSRNFDWSGDDWSGDDWSGDDWYEDDWSSDENDWPHDWSSDEDDWSSDENDWPHDWPHDWSSGKKDETEDGTRPPYEGLGTGYENSDWGGPGTVPTDPYTPPYEGALGTGYEGSDWGGPGHISQPNQHQQSQKPSHIPRPPRSEWPPSIFPENSDWGRSEDTPDSSSEPRIPESNISPSPGQHTPQNNPQVSDYDKGFSDGLKAISLGQGPDFVNLKNNDWSEDYKKGYMAAFGTPYTPSTT
ncbi:lysis inhibitor protein [Streptococcus pyogenes]|uniref:lysis inhibitor protein n=1 Tax=Streptococcus pyogenes TaxID=1314 RepID=UPI00109D65A0|nr:lysis inhibitor protein [Streptococcus pyogenes]VGV40260.1 sic family protein [Streptococcus pyogenes]